MVIGHSYIDPIYIVIASMVVFLATLVVGVYTINKRLKEIRDAVRSTERNTEPMRKIGIVMYSTSSPAVDDDSITDRIPSVRSNIPGSAFAAPSGKLRIGSTLQSNREPYERMDATDPMPRVEPKQLSIPTSDYPQFR